MVGGGRICRGLALIIELRKEWLANKPFVTCDSYLLCATINNVTQSMAKTLFGNKMEIDSSQSWQMAGKEQMERRKKNNIDYQGFPCLCICSWCLCPSPEVLAAVTIYMAQLQFALLLPNFPPLRWLFHSTNCPATSFKLKFFRKNPTDTHTGTQSQETRMCGWDILLCSAPFVLVIYENLFIFVMLHLQM